MRFGEISRGVVVLGKGISVSQRVIPTAQNKIKRDKYNMEDLESDNVILIPWDKKHRATHNYSRSINASALGVKRRWGEETTRRSAAVRMGYVPRCGCSSSRKHATEYTCKTILGALG